MRSFITTAIAASLISVASIGTASAFTSTGVIESIDTVSNIVKIRNGDAYKLPAEKDLSVFQAGERVNVNWDTQNPLTVRDGSKSDATVKGLYANDIEHAG